MIPLRVSAAVLRWVFIWTILLSSATSLIQASGVTGNQPNLAVIALASVEIAAILAFASERWRAQAAVVLLLVFAVAFVGTAVAGEFAARFIYFAASTIFLQGVDGPESQERPLV